MNGKIDTTKFTKRMIMETQHSLDYYTYIQSNYSEGGAEFEDVYSIFYGLDINPLMRTPNNKTIYFNMLYDNAVCNVIDVLEKLYNSMNGNQYQFSFVTKLVHTKNVNSPIFDSKIKKYLSREMGVVFWQYNHRENNVQVPRLDIYRHNWDTLVCWYKEFIKQPKTIKMLKWFDSKFPQFKKISDVKKIDTMIFIWVKYNN